MMPKVVAAKKHLLALRSDVDIDDYIAHVDYYYMYSVQHLHKSKVYDVYMQNH
jgi:hypothetical protein